MKRLTGVQRIMLTDCTAQQRPTQQRPTRLRTALIACVLGWVSAVAMAGPEEGRSAPRGHESGPRERIQAEGHRGSAGAAPVQRSAAGSQRWYDGAHGHGRYYPAPGWAVRSLPPRANIVFWGGVNYGFHDGIWYSPGARGYVVVRPPFGIVVADLPAFRTVVTVGGVAYQYADGTYYRERGEGGYEVVPSPLADDGSPSGGAPAHGATGQRMFIYPRQGQSAQAQASDEYECHRWAVAQSGFDPTAAATATAGAPPARRADYQRAQSACLEGRGYTVR